MKLNIYLYIMYIYIHCRLNGPQANPNIFQITKIDDFVELKPQQLMEVYCHAGSNGVASLINALKNPKRYYLNNVDTGASSSSLSSSTAKKYVVMLISYILCVDGILLIKMLAVQAYLCKKMLLCIKMTALSKNIEIEVVLTSREEEVLFCQDFKGFFSLLNFSYVY